jgi:hypothetical protein
MGLNFPASPAINDLYPVPAVPGVPQYKWNGTVWLANAGGGAAGGDFLPLAGGQLTGNLGIGVPNANPLTIGDNTTWAFTTEYWGFEHDSFNGVANASSAIWFGRGRGTYLAPTVVQNGDSLGGFAFGGVDGTQPYANIWSAAVWAIVDGPVAAGSVPTAITFNSAPTDGGVERLRISSDGKVHLTNPVPIVDADQVSTKLYVDSKAPVAATVAEYRSNSAPTKMLTPGTAWGAMTSVDLSGTEVAGVLTIDFNSGFDFFWYISAAGRTLANPTGLKTGQRGTITLSNTGAGTITTWGSKWKFPGGVKPTLTPNAVDLLSYFVADPAANIYCTVGTDFK